MSIEELNSDVHFHDSLEFLRLSNYESAMKSIDLAISINNKKGFYIFQKIKMLFVARMFIPCADYIIENLRILYEDSPLYIFSQIIYYYEKSSSCSITDLEDLLLSNNIPSILAKEFTTFIDIPDMDPLEKIISSKETHNYASCIDYCNLLLNKDPENLTTHLIKAECHCLLGDHNTGISAYQYAITLAPNVPSIYNKLGSVFLNLEYYPKAISCFQKSFDLDPSSIYVVTQLAESFYLWKKYDSALIYFKKSLSINPDCSETLLRIASTYEETNKPKKAKKYYKKVLDKIKYL